MSPRRLLIRADTGPDVGWGHAARSLAIAHAWQDGGGSVTFALGTSVDRLAQRLRDERMDVVAVPADPGSAGDAAWTSTLARHLGCQWVVLDGYGFGPQYREAIRRAGLLIVAVDDLGADDMRHADVILNPNVHAHPDMYRIRDDRARLAIGPQYALLRREFRTWCARRRKPAVEISELLVTFGGTDATGLILTVMEALTLSATQARVTIVAGGSLARVDELAGRLATTPLRARIEREVDDMPRLMAATDFAISGAGTTGSELAFMGVPFIAVVLAENQRPVAEAVAEAGIAINVGWHGDVSAATLAAVFEKAVDDPGARREMSRRGPRLIDGRGAERVVMLLDETPR